MASYIGNVPAAQATQTRQSLTAVAGQTTFGTAGYTPGYIDVYLNGVHLEPTDFEASNGSDIVLLSAAELDDILTYVSYTTFEVSNLGGLATEAYVDNAIATNVDFTGYATETYVDTAVANVDVTAELAQVASDYQAADATTLANAQSYADAAVAGLVDTAPAALDTLNELAAALGDDPNFATTVSTQIGTKADAVHGHAISDVTGLQSALDGKVDDSQVLTNVPAGAVFTDTVYTHPTAHPISMIDGLQTVLDGKQPVGDYALNSAIPVDVSDLTDNAAILFTGSYLDLSDKPTIPEPAQAGVFFENDTTLTSDYTITAGKNAMTAGPITIADGVTVTIPDGSTWTVV
jgi:hypothetical protein